MSLALRSGVPIEAIIDQAKTIKPCKAYCDRTKKYGDTSKGTSCPSAIGFALDELNKKIQDRCFAEGDIDIDCKECMDYTPKQLAEPKKDNYTCPECGSKLINEGGCVICKGDENHAGCGWSKCD